MQDEEFRQAISHHYTGVFRLCCRYFGNSDDANDAVQDIVMKVWTNRHRFRGESSPGTWIYRIATNVCLTALEKRKHTVRLPDFEELSDNTPDDYEEEKEKKKMKEEKLQFFQRFMDSLNSADRLLVSLYLEEMDSMDIAAVTGLTGSNVRTRISRIKSQIKKVWEESNGIR
jgi:RNA polymerase sigma-70 factor (ECF subfamily)